jgi:iron complex outermembrane receptor protein
MACAAVAPGPARAQSASESQLPALVVEDERLRAAASLAELSARDAAHTPLAIDAVGAGEISDRGVTSLAGLVRGLPSVRDSYDTFGYVETLQVRGFRLDESLNTRRDGMAASSHVPMALENKERVEVLKGVSGMLAGVSAPGGMVNYIVKQPTAGDLREADATISERGSLRMHVDLGGHFDSGDGAPGARDIGYRINAAVEERRPGIDHAWSRRAMASAFLDWHAGAGSLVQAEFEMQRLRAISVPGFGLVDSRGTGTGTSIPAPVDPRVNLNSQPWTQPFESTSGSGSLRLQQALSGAWELSLRLGLQRSLTNDRIAFPDGCSGAANYVYNGMCAGSLTDIWQYVSDGERRDASDADARLHGKVDILGAEHEVTMGARVVHHVERYPPYQAYNFAGTVDIASPALLPGNAAATNPNAPYDLHEEEFYGYDVARLGARASAWLGLRASRIGQHSALTDGSQETRLSQQAFTPWLGAGWEPAPGAFAWMSAGSGVEVSSAPNHPVTVRTTGASLMLSNAGQALPAQRSRQWEIGLRLAGPGESRLEATAFRIDKPFADVVALDAMNGIEVAGARRQRDQGLEFEGDWRAGKAWQLRAAATWLDARTSSAPDATWVGHPAINTARLAGYLDGEWTAKGGAAWSNRINFTSPVAALPDGSASLPSSWQWDSFARWTGHDGSWQWTIRLGVENLTDRRYWREAPMAPWGSVYLFPATARTYRIAVEFSR